MKVDTIAARFNGADLKFRLSQGRIEAEERIHGSLYALLKRIAAGAWTVADIRNVLTWGYPGKRQWAGGTGPVDLALKANKPATYQPLALAILAGALIGLTVEQAVFSDEGDDDDA